MERLSKVHKVVSQLCSKCGHSCKSDKQYCPNYKTADQIRYYASRLQKMRMQGR